MTVATKYTPFGRPPGEDVLPTPYHLGCAGGLIQRYEETLRAQLYPQLGQLKVELDWLNTKLACAVEAKRQLTDDGVAADPGLPGQSHAGPAAAADGPGGRLSATGQGKRW